MKIVDDSLREQNVRRVFSLEMVGALKEGKTVLVADEDGLSALPRISSFRSAMFSRGFNLHTRLTSQGRIFWAIPIPR